MCDLVNQSATAPPRQRASTQPVKVFDHACSWAVRSTEKFEQHHIEENRRGTQVTLQPRLQLAASLLCMMDVSCIDDDDWTSPQSAACELHYAHPCRLARAPKLVTATTAPASSALLGVLIHQSSPAEASIASSAPRQRPAEASIAFSAPRPAPGHVTHLQQSHMQQRARQPGYSGNDTEGCDCKGLQSSSASLPASAMSKSATSTCLLCGVIVRSTDLQGHVAADIDKLDRGASAALPLAEEAEPVAGVARKHVEPSALQLNVEHVEQQQDQQHKQQQLHPFHHIKGMSHADTSCNRAVYAHHRDALGESNSLAGNRASNAQQYHHQRDHAACGGPQHSNHARASSQAAHAKQADENKQESASSGAALGHGPAPKCSQHKRRQAAGIRSLARHQAGRCQLSQEQAHKLSTSNRGVLQQQEMRWKPYRMAGVRKNSQVTRAVHIRTQT